MPFITSFPLVLRWVSLKIAYGEGDSGLISIGAGSNIQDDVVLGSGCVTVGEGVTIGHGAIIKVRFSCVCVGGGAPRKRFCTTEWHVWFCVLCLQKALFGQNPLSQQCVHLISCPTLLENAYISEVFVHASCCRNTGYVRWCDSLLVLEIPKLPPSIFSGRRLQHMGQYHLTMDLWVLVFLFSAFWQPLKTKGLEEPTFLPLANL